MVPRIGDFDVGRQFDIRRGHFAGSFAIQGHFARFIIGTLFAARNDFEGDFLHIQ